jgi:hypothetical protein
MACQAVAFFHKQEQREPWHTQSGLLAVRAISNALVVLRKRLNDETLLAVLCLDISQQLRSDKAVNESVRPYLKGALALIQHRSAAASTMG